MTDAMLRRSLLMAVTGVAAYLVGHHVLVDRAQESQRPDTSVPPIWRGRQLLVILVGTSECRFTADASTALAYQQIASAEESRAVVGVEIVRRVGIALDTDPRVGLTTLSAAGSFDEMIVGGGLLNTGATHFLHRDLAGHVAVPQVLLVSRLVDRNGGSYVIGADSLHRRLVGVAAITSWAQRLSQTRE